MKKLDDVTLANLHMFLLAKQPKVASEKEALPSNMQGLLVDIGNFRLTSKRREHAISRLATLSPAWGQFADEYRAECAKAGLND